MKEIEQAPLSKGARDETEKVRCDGKKRGRSEGTRDRGNKPDGEFEGGGVNGDRRRTDGERGRESAGGSQRGREGEAHRG